MKFTLSWLKDHLETDASLTELTDKLTAIGLEIEDVIDPGAAIEGFVVAEVLEAGKHPNADRLTLCKVTDGTSEFQVVCGAPNARAGIKAVLARKGDVIPDSGTVFKPAKIRDVESQAMLCSVRELKLGEDHDGIIELPENAEVGAPATSALAIDPVIDIALTPNRVDALGVRGVARDLAAAGLGTLKTIDDSPVEGRFDSPTQVSISAEGDCTHFVGRTIRGVKNVESPQWMKDRLTAIGLRPISALVDITQYLTIDLGRPLHVFDADKVNGSLQARHAKDGETLEALNDKDYTLSDGMVVIADDSAALGLGGIVGGRPSGSEVDTKTVVLESAWFNPITIANTGRKLQINTDARYAFERGVDPESTIPGAEVATRMILDICGGEASHLVQAGAPKDVTKQVDFRPSRVKTLGGVDVAAEDCTAILERLGFTVAGSGDSLTVTTPSWRADIDGEADLVEEVLRITGYDNIPAVLDTLGDLPKAVLTPLQKRTDFARRSLAARGLNEAVTWAFLAEKDAALFSGGNAPVHLQNPLSSDLDVMRPSVLPNLIAAAGRNAARGFGDVALFEIGPAFRGDQPGDQDLIAAGIRAGQAVPRGWTESKRLVDAFDAKADALAALEAAEAPVASLQIGQGPDSGVPGWYHPGRAGALRLGNQVLGVFGELHPAVLKALDVAGPVVGFEVFLERVPPKKKKTHTRPLADMPDLQAVERDFAFLVDSTVAADDVLRAARGADKKLITEAALFDVYEGDKLEAGKKSLALSVTLQPREATLTDEDLEAISGKIVDAVARATGGSLRA